MSDEPLRANPGYALGQLASALTTAETHADPETRERATRRAMAWTRTLEGLLSGALAVGSRTPIQGVPAWATPEVVQGGFVTGTLLAAGPLRPHELQLLARLGRPADETARAALNAYHLTEPGLRALGDALRSGAYSLEVPEEGALLVVAWLLEHGRTEAARSILEAITPYLGHLRFYPAPAAARLIPDGSVVHVETVADAVSRLERVRPRRQPLAQREALLLWRPLEDEVVALFHETVAGSPPSVGLGPDARPARRADGRWDLSGGWPCQLFPGGWKERASATLERAAAALAAPSVCGRPREAGTVLHDLLPLLRRAVDAPASLTGREVGKVRCTLAHVAAKRGLPGAPELLELRARQRAVAAAPLIDEVARVVAARLAGRPRDRGLDGPEAVEALAGPITPEEGQRHRVPTGHPVPDRLRRCLTRCVEAPLPWLVEQGVIPSSEVLARVVPQVTARVTSAGVADPDLRRLDAALYAAFRRRRSLLLLDLSKQVQAAELPWVAAIDAERRAGSDAANQARRTLEELAALALRSFPQAIVPNRLLKELRALSERAGLKLALVDELAADIFVGAFTEKFLAAAHHAAVRLDGTLYAKYYDLPVERLRGLHDIGSGRGAPTSAGFLSLCTERAHEEGRATERRGRSVAWNGRIIEQAQVLTTHNLLALTTDLGLEEALRPVAAELARKVFRWALRLAATLSGRPWKPALRAIKDLAYGWRQMVFWLSLLPAEEQRTFVGWARDQLGAAPRAGRLAPAVVGLAEAAQGRTPELPPQARRLLGWTTGRHWLLEPEAKTS